MYFTKIDLDMNDNMKQKSELFPNTTREMKRLYSVSEAANYMAISESALYKYIECDMITYARLPSIPDRKRPPKKGKGKIVFEIEYLDNFIEKYITRKEIN